MPVDQGAHQPVQGGKVLRDADDPDRRVDIQRRAGGLPPFAKTLQDRVRYALRATTFLIGAEDGKIPVPIAEQVCLAAQLREPPGHLHEKPVHFPALEQP